MIEGTPESDRNWLMLLEKRGEKKQKVERQEEERWRELESGGLWQAGDRCDLGLGSGNQAVKASVYFP